MRSWKKELNERLAPAGINILEARISHLAYSAEIAGAMLQRQQATAIVAARTKIVEGAVGMVEMALDMLSKKQIVELDEERKATMVSNLLVVLCGERGAQPVLNTEVSTSRDHGRRTTDHTCSCLRSVRREKRKEGRLTTDH
jgi:regulator of protease activity HflC (stomatin/prohibitin superfamily)